MSAPRPVSLHYEEDLMPLLLNRLALATLCLLPAAAMELHSPSRPLLASFMYSCDASTPQPRVTTKYTAAGRPRAKPDLAPVAIYERGKSPDRAYETIGEVHVLAAGSRMAVSELDSWAIKGARKLGGDAIVDVWYEDAAQVSPKAGDPGLLYLSASVVRWQ